MNKNLKDFLLIAFASIISIILYGKVLNNVQGYLEMLNLSPDLIQKCLATFFSIITAFCTMIILNIATVIKPILSCLSRPCIKIDFWDKKNDVVKILSFANIEDTNFLRIKLSTTLNKLQSIILKRLNAKIRIYLTSKIGVLALNKGFNEDDSSWEIVETLDDFSHSKRENSINQDVVIQMIKSGNCEIGASVETSPRKLKYIFNLYCKVKVESIEIKGNF